MLQAYRTITVDVDLGNEKKTIEVPFTVELLARVEETLHRATGKTWFRLHKSEKSVIEAFNWFAEPYLGGIDLSKVQPNFAPLFFSNVKNELLNSVNKCDELVFSMGESSEPTEETNQEEGQPSE